MARLKRVSDVPATDSPVALIDRPEESAVRAQSVAMAKSLTVKPVVYVQPPTKKYWLGTLDSSPLHAVYAGGQDFPRYINVPEKDPATGVMIPEAKRKGRFVNLTDAQVKSILASLARKYVRDDRIGSMESPRYRAAPGDEPVAKHVYFVEVQPNMPYDYITVDPEPVYQE